MSTRFCQRVNRMVRWEILAVNDSFCTTDTDISLSVSIDQYKTMQQNPTHLLTLVFLTVSFWILNSSDSKSVLRVQTKVH